MRVYDKNLDFVRIRNITPGIFINNELKHTYVNTIYSDSGGDVWIGTNILQRFDSRTQTLHRVTAIYTPRAIAGNKKGFSGLAVVKALPLLIPGNILFQNTTKTTLTQYLLFLR